MKLKTTSTLGAALVAALALTSAASAAFIKGSIDIAAFNSSVNIDKTLNTVAFVDNGPPAGNAIVNGGTLDFTGFLGATATYSNFTYSPFVPISPLWALTSFPVSFDLLAVSSIDETGTGLILTGTGTILALGYDPTPGTWSFSADQANASTLFTFSSQTAPSVPDGGTTVALLGFSLLGLHGLRRKLGK